MIWVLSFSLYVLCEILLFERGNQAEDQGGEREKRKRKRGDEDKTRGKKRKIEIEENEGEIKEEVRKELEEETDHGDFYSLFSAKNKLLHVVTRCGLYLIDTQHNKMTHFFFFFFFQLGLLKKKSGTKKQFKFSTFSCCISQIIPKDVGGF